MNSKKIYSVIALTAVTISSIAFGSVYGAQPQKTALSINASAQKQEKPITITVNNTILQTTGYEKDLLPVREVCNTLGYELKWDSNTNSLLITNGSITAKLSTGDTNYVVDDDMVFTLDTPPVIINNLVYVPAQFFHDVFYCNINHIENNHISLSLGQNNIIEQNTKHRVALNNYFSLTLPTNGTTGYEWTYSIEKQQSDGSYKPLEENDLTLMQTQENRFSNALGSPSQKQWIFRCDKTGQYQLKFEYSRPWEKKEPIKTAVFEIVAE